MSLIFIDKIHELASKVNMLSEAFQFKKCRLATYPCETGKIGPFNIESEVSMAFPVDIYADSFLKIPTAKFGSKRSHGRIHAGCDIYVPEEVEEGRILGYVKHTKYVSPMLHFGMYGCFATGPLTVRNNKPSQRRKDLIDSTAWHIAASEQNACVATPAILGLLGS